MSFPILPSSATTPGLCGLGSVSLTLDEFPNTPARSCVVRTVCAQTLLLPAAVIIVCVVGQI